jgi:hypothetical protein
MRRSTPFCPGIARFMRMVPERRGKGLSKRKSRGTLASIDRIAPESELI